MEWFSDFRQGEYRGPLDIVLLQITLVVKGEANKMNALYCAIWGFMAVEKHGLTISTKTDVRRRESLFSLIRTLPSPRLSRGRRGCGRITGRQHGLSSKVVTLSLLTSMRQSINMSARRCSRGSLRSSPNVPVRSYLKTILTARSTQSSNRSHNVPVSRHNSLALRHLRTRTNLVDMLDDEIERVEKDTDTMSSTPDRTRTSTTCPTVPEKDPASIGVTSFHLSRTGVDTSRNPSQDLRLIKMG